MAKFNSKLPKKEIDKYFIQLCIAISETKNIQEAAELLRDLLSYQEAEMIAKRLKIAELLSYGLTYEKIKEEIKVSTTTIARVQEWMRVSGEGYRRAFKGIKKKNIKKTFNIYRQENWLSIKKRFPAYHWPQILLEQIVSTANTKQKKQLQKALLQMDKMKEKNELFNKLNKLLITRKD